MPADRKKPLDALVVLAKASFGQRRYRSPARLGVTAAVLVLLVAVPVYLLWPRAPQPPLLLTAFDQVALPGETVALYARVEPVAEETTPVNLSRYALYFQEPASDWHPKLLTDQDGRVSVSRSFSPTDKPVEITVRYPGDELRQRGSQATLRVFVWPSETKLLLVDAERTLPVGDETTLWNANNLDIRPRPGAVATLRAARGKYRIGYLARSADRPARYNKLRAWLERSWAPVPEQLPDGPVLAPADSQPAGEQEFLRRTLKELKDRFAGSAVGVTADVDRARWFHEAGWETFLLNESDDPPEGVNVIKSWSELQQRLP